MQKLSYFYSYLLFGIAIEGFQNPNYFCHGNGNEDKANLSILGSGKGLVRRDVVYFFYLFVDMNNSMKIFMV